MNYIQNLKINFNLKSNTIFISGFILLLLPFYVFLTKNFYEILYQYKLTIVYIFLFFLLSSYIFSKFISYIFKINFQLIFFYLNLSFYIQHNFSGFFESKLESFNIKGGTSLEVAFLLLALLVILFFFQLKTKNNFFQFFFIFSILNLIYNSALILKYIYVGNFFSQIENSNNLLVKKNKKLFNNNIYVIVLDSMVSLEKAEKYLNVDNSKFLKKLNKNNLTYFSNSESVSVTTRHTFASLFNLNPVLLDHKKFKNRPKLLFPGTIKDSNLLKLLKNKNINFFWIGNEWMDCFNYDTKYCLESENNFGFVFYNLHDFEYFFKIFIKNSFLNKIILKVTSSNKKYYDKQDNITFEFETDEKYHTQNALKNFEKFYKKIKIPKYNNFYFIHHWSPHPPFIFDKNCNFKNTNSTIATLQNFNLDEYKYNYICTQNDLINFLDFIKIYDSNAHIIIFGDSGMNLEMETNDLKKHFSKYDIFTAISTNSLCETTKTYSTNLNHLKTFLNCVLDSDLNIENDNRYYEYNDKINLYNKIDFQ